MHYEGNHPWFWGSNIPDSGQDFSTLYVPLSCRHATETLLKKAFQKRINRKTSPAKPLNLWTVKITEPWRSRVGQKVQNLNPPLKIKTEVKHDRLWEVHHRTFYLHQQFPLNCVGLSPDNASACVNSKETEKEQTFIGKTLYTEDYHVILQDLSVSLVGDYSATLCVKMWGDFFLEPHSCINLYILCKLLLQAATERSSYFQFHL